MKTCLRWIAISSLFVTTACSAPAQMPRSSATNVDGATPASSPASPASPAGWTSVEAPGLFSMEAPAGTRHAPLKGIDSKVGQFEGNGCELMYDYGGWSDPLDEMAAEPGARVERVDVAGTSAKIVTVPTGGRVRIALHIAEVPGKRGTKLTISGPCVDDAAAAGANRMLRSLRFAA